MEINLDPKIIVALDYNNSEDANRFIEQIEPSQCALKVGKELFTAVGPQFVETLIQKNFRVFLDLKYHDIPNTVAKACQVAADLGVWMLTLHTMGGAEMLSAAREAIDNHTHKPLLIGVTVLTSFNQNDLAEIGIESSLNDCIVKLATLAKNSQLDGVVCSGHDIAVIQQNVNDNFCFVTPGIRPQAVESNDQKRVMTPSDALSAGANYLVIGRPITHASEPQNVLEAINATIC